MDTNLERFITAQARSYETALSEIRNGRKQTHWMWYIFPQLKGLGKSQTADYYAIRDIREATAYLHHPTLGRNLVKITKLLLATSGRTAAQIFGDPDDLKLRSSMTLFCKVRDTSPIFAQVLNKYFDGRPDLRTLVLLSKRS